MMNKLVKGWLVTILLLDCTTLSSQRSLPKMPIGEKIGQMLQVLVHTTALGRDGFEYQIISQQLTRDHIGSLEFASLMDGPNLKKYPPNDVAAVFNIYQKTSEIPLLVASDIERGLIARVANTPDIPTVMALGAGGDPAFARRLGKVTAQEAIAVGIHWALAPVADVNDEPDNPVVGDRSFGEDPALVSRMVAAYVAGAHTGGMLVTAKHFPGHGDTPTDSHVGIVTLNQPLEHLRRVEFAPFRAAIAEGVDAIMLAHERVPALDADPKKLATTSAKVIQGYLRGELGFKGVVITDAMEMRGLTELYRGDPHPVARAAVDAVKAGADIIMLPDHVDEVYDAILAAVKSGEIPESRIDESVKRILAMKERAGLFQNRFVDASKIHEVFMRKSDWDLAQQIADNAVTLVRDKSFALPLSIATASTKSDTEQKRTVLVLLTDSHLSPLGKAFEEEFRRRQPDVQTRHIYYDNRSTWETGDLLDIVRGADSVVIAAFMTNLPGKKDMAAGGQVVNVVGLNGQSAELFRQVVDIAGPRAMIVSLGSPYLILRYAIIQNYVCTFSISSTSERAAVKALFGEIQNKAKLPVSLPGVAERGFAIAWPQKRTGTQ